jgi:PAS domain S-box-containing protein
LIAALAGFAFLHFANRIAELDGSVLRFAWMMAGAVTMGLGVWAMHFVGMLAYRLPIAVGYDLLITTFSLLPAIIGSSIALYVVARPNVNMLRLFAGAVALGAGIGTMHYTGMAALHFDAFLRYDPILFATSIVVAVALAFVALFTTLWSMKRQETGLFSLREGAGALVLGLAVAGMHYTAMTSAYCFADESIHDTAGIESDVFAVMTAIVAVLVLLMVIAGIFFDRRLRIEIALVIERSQALHERESEYQNLVDNSIQGLFVIRRGDLMFANDSCARMFGYSVEELKALRPWAKTLYHPDEFERLQYYAEQRAQGDRSPRRIEIRALKKDKTPIWLEQMTSVIDWHGERAIQIAVVDITEQKKAEQELFQAQKMEAIGNLAGGLSHEFNNMLLPIIALTEMTMDDLPNDHEGRENLSAVMEAALHAKHLVNQVMVFSRQNEYPLVQIDLAAAVADGVARLRGELPSGISIVEAIDPAIGPTMADSEQIVSLILNLGSNSADAMTCGVGEIRIALAPIDTGAGTTGTGAALDPDRSYVRLTVRDNGRGMDAATLEKIFNPFFTTKQVGTGTGLGLAMVHGIVQRFDGAIDVKSEPSVGTTFDVYLPLLTADAARAVAAAA